MTGGTQLAYNTGSNNSIIQTQVTSGNYAIATQTGGSGNVAVQHQ